MSNYNEAVLSSGWYTAENSDIGGWEIRSESGHFVADAISREVAQEICEDHNSRVIFF